MTIRHTLMLTASFVVVSTGIAAAERSLEQLQEQAQQGDPAAQLSLAIRYRDAKGIAKDDAAAMQWAHRAADQGHADALDFVGFAYLRGAVVKRKPEIAFGYFKAAAENSAQAAFNLGQCYYGAQGTEQDCAKASTGGKRPLQKVTDAQRPRRRWRCFPAKACRPMRRRRGGSPSVRRN
jgi:hypothetical protein